MEATLRTDPDMVAEWLQINMRNRKAKVYTQSFARVICETSSGGVDTWWGRIAWETSLNDHETKVYLEQ